MYDLLAKEIFLIETTNIICHSLERLIVNYYSMYFKISKILQYLFKNTSESICFKENDTDI